MRPSIKKIISDKPPLRKKGRKHTNRLQVRMRAIIYIRIFFTCIQLGVDAAGDGLQVVIDLLVKIPSYFQGLCALNYVAICNLLAC